MRDWKIRRPTSPRAFLLALSIACASCQHIGPPPCSGELANLAASERRKLHLRLELTRDGRTRRHEVIVQVEPGQVRAIGLTPLGTAAFGLTHDATGIEVENRIGRHLGYQPRRVYDAIVHAYLARTPGPNDPPATALVTRGPDGLRVENDRCGYSARLVSISDERA